MQAEDDSGLGQDVSVEVMNWSGFWMHCESIADIGGEEEYG